MTTYFVASEKRNMYFVWKGQEISAIFQYPYLTANQAVLYMYLPTTPDELDTTQGHF